MRANWPVDPAPIAIVKLRAKIHDDARFDGANLRNQVVSIIAGSYGMSQESVGEMYDRGTVSACPVIGDSDLCYVRWE